MYRKIRFDPIEFAQRDIATEYSAPVIALGNNITPVSVFIGTSAAPSSGAAFTCGIDQQPVCPVLNITVNAVSV